METYTKSTTNLHKHDGLWKQAIVDSQEEIAKAQRRIARLRRSIKIFTKKAATGESWPGKPE